MQDAYADLIPKSNPYADLVPERKQSRKTARRPARRQEPEPKAEPKPAETKPSRTTFKPDAGFAMSKEQTYTKPLKQAAKGQMPSSWPPPKTNALSEALGRAKTPTAKELVTPKKRSKAQVAAIATDTPEQQRNKRVYDTAKQVAVSKGLKPPPNPTTQSEMDAVIEFVRTGNTREDVTQEQLDAKTMRDIEKGTSFGTQDPMAGKSIDEAQAHMTAKVMERLGMGKDNIVAQMVAGWIPSIMAEVGVLGSESYSPLEKIGAAANIGLNTIVGPEIVAGKAAARLADALQKMGKGKAAQVFDSLSHPLQTLIAANKDVRTGPLKGSIERLDLRDTLEFVRTGKEPPVTKFLNDVEASTRPADMSPKPKTGGSRHEIERTARAERIRDLEESRPFAPSEHTDPAKRLAHRKANEEIDVEIRKLQDEYLPSEKEAAEAVGKAATGKRFKAHVVRAGEKGHPETGDFYASTGLGTTHYGALGGKGLPRGVDVDLQNPLVVGTRGELAEALGGGKLSELAEKVKRTQDEADFTAFDIEAAKAARAKGHDGIIYKTENYGLDGAEGHEIVDLRGIAKYATPTDPPISAQGQGGGKVPETPPTVRGDEGSFNFGGKRDADQIARAGRFLADPQPEHSLIDPDSPEYDRFLDHAIQKAYGKEPKDGGSSELIKDRLYAALQREQLDSTYTAQIADDIKEVLKRNEQGGSLYRWRKGKDGTWRPDTRSGAVAAYDADAFTPETAAELLDFMQSMDDGAMYLNPTEHRNALGSTKKAGVATWDTPPGGRRLSELASKDMDPANISIAGLADEPRGVVIPRTVVEAYASSKLGVLDEVDPNSVRAILSGEEVATAAKAYGEALDPPKTVPPSRTTAQADVRRELGLDVETAPETVGKWIEDAESLKGKEAGIAAGVNIKPRSLSKTEEIALGRRFYKAIDERDAAAAKGDSELYDALDDELMTIATALDVSGSEWGRQGVARQIQLAEDFSEFGLRRRAEKMAGRALTESETLELKTLAEELVRANAKIAELEAKPPEVMAATAPGVRKSIQVKRRAILADIKTKWKNAAPPSQVRSDPFGAAAVADASKQIAAIAPDVVKLAKSYVDEGVVVLEELVAKVKGHLDHLGIKLADDDIKGIVAGRIKAEKQARDLRTDWEKVKAQASKHFADERDRIAAAERTAKAEKTAAADAEAAEWRAKERKRKAAEKEFWARVREEEAEFRKAERAERSAERKAYSKAVRESLGGERAGVLNQIDRLSEKIRQLDSGEWEAGATRAKPSPELLESYVVRDSLQRQARIKEAALKLEADLRNKSLAGRVADETAGTLRTLLTFGDASAPLTQGGLYALLHPWSWAKASGHSVKAIFSTEKGFQRYMEALRSGPNFDRIMASGVELPGLNAAGPSEFFFETKAKKVPVLKNAIQGSQQGYDAALTLMRTDLMDGWLNAADASGRPIDLEGLKVLGKAANTFTGRGPNFGKASEALGRALFAPSWWASQWQVATGVPFWNALRYAKASGNTMPLRLIAKEYAKVAGGYVATLGVTAAVIDAKREKGETDWHLETNPQSSLFGKFWKHSGGELVSVDFLPIPMTAPVKQFAQLAPILGSTLDKDESSKDDAFTRQTGIGRLIEGKEAPVLKNLYSVGDSMNVTEANAAGANKKYPFGKNTDPRSGEGVGNLALSSMPIGWQQVKEGAESKALTGPEKAILMILALAGRGPNSYESDAPERSDVSILLKWLRSQK